MVDDDRGGRLLSVLGRLVSLIGRLWIILIIAAWAINSFQGGTQLTIGMAFAAAIPGWIAIRIGRAISRRGTQASGDDVSPMPAPAGASSRRGRGRPEPEPPRPRPRPRTETSLPDRAKVQADLEEALAAYRAEPDDEPVSIEPIVIERPEFKPKTSAEMVEEARRKFNKRS